MNRVALITGAAGGIGRATTELLLAEGWQVVGVDHIAAGEFPPGAELWEFDLEESSSAEAIADRLGREVTRLDALVNNAAVQVSRPILESTEQDWERVFQVNLRAVFDLTRRVFPLLKSTRGTVVNISSVHGLATSKNIAAYGASKGGLVALTRAMALEFGPDGVRVNSILPGAVDTPMLRDGLARSLIDPADSDELLEILASRTALGRIGQSREIAQAILFLADSERSSYITGQTLVVDGGALARLSTE